MMNWKGPGSKWLWHNLTYYPNIPLEGLRKPTKKLSQNSRFSDRDWTLYFLNTKRECSPADHDVRCSAV